MGYRKYSLRECLIEWNLRYDISFISSFSIYSCSLYYLISIQICTAWMDASLAFLRLEELKEAMLHSAEGVEGMSWGEPMIAFF